MQQAAIVPLFALLATQCPAGTPDSLPQKNWVLVKQVGCQQVYNQCRYPGSKVPVIKIEGRIDVPCREAVQIIWDESYEYPQFMTDYLIEVRRVNPGGKRRHDFYLYRMPWFSRVAVAVGSLFRGTVGRHQYCTLRLTKTQLGDGARITWEKIPTPREAKPKLPALEIKRAEGYWELTPLGTHKTKIVYVIDGYPGGVRVPGAMIRRANNTAIGIPKIIENRYKSLHGR